ncbi:DUF167 domain-containing protein [Schlesneria sp. T3-172]|uniref:DUF167 domain-containing protein n=1 Tax=Schlesneria TaxID=656899 RepID=UPI002EF9E4F6
MIELAPSEHGVIIPVKAHPGARRNGITGVHDGALKVAVSQAPEKGKANAAITKVLADSLGIRKSQIQLVSGPTSALKKFLVSDIDPQELKSQITRLLSSLPE